MAVTMGPSVVEDAADDDWIVELANPGVEGLGLGVWDRRRWEQRLEVGHQR